MKKLMAALFAAMLLHAVPADAQAAVAGGYNGFGQCTRPSGSLSYGAGAITKLFACMNGSTVIPMPVTITGSMPGPNLITGARLYTTGSAASGAQFKVHLFSGTPTIGSLVDAATYIGPYAADMSGYIGTLSCSSMQATNDASPTYWSECSIGNLVNQTLRFTNPSGGSVAPLQATVEVTNGYTADSQEKLTINLSTVPVQ